MGPATPSGARGRARVLRALAGSLACVACRPSEPPAPALEGLDEHALTAPSPARTSTPLEESRSSPPQTTTVERPVIENLMPAPIPLAERLRPCRVDFDHSFLGEDDERWEVTTTPVRGLVWDWEAAGRSADWARAPVAPIPMTLAQARALRESANNVAETTIAGATVVFVHFADSVFAYAFDDRGRSVEVDWDPVANSATYRFRYAYTCDTDATPPAWRDERD